MVIKSTLILAIPSLVIVLYLLPMGCQIQKETPASCFPGESWAVASPSDFGIDTFKMGQAIQFLESKCYADGIEELLIVKNGYVIFSGDSTYKQHNIWSCSKSFTSTVLGLLSDQKIIALDDKVAMYDSTFLALYPEVTFRHFTTMTSGYSAKGRSRWSDENEDWSHTPYTPEPPHFPPGTQFEYWDEAQMMFGRVLTKVLGESMHTFLKRNITDPIGMGTWEWHPEKEVEDIPINNGCTNVVVSARQLARFGLLYLREGRWKDQQLISPGWCRSATTTQVASDLPVYQGDRAHVRGSGSYGYNWWVNSKDGLSKMPDAPLKTAYMSGLNHNVCFIIPEWDIVIVRMGVDGNPSEGKHIVWNEFLRLFSEALPDTEI